MTTGAGEQAQRILVRALFRSFMNRLLLVVSALLLGATLLPLSRDKVWRVRSCDFPRLQLAVLLLADIALLACFPGGAAGLPLAVQAVLVCCLIRQVAWIVRYTPLAPKEVRPAGPQTKGSDRLRLMTAHVLMGNRDPRCGRGMFNTFHADYPFMRFPLDHVFHSAALALVAMRRLPHIGSDHFPILVELQLDAEP